MSSPLEYQDLFGYRRVEPSVTGLVEVQTVESARPGTYNDLIILSPFHSGASQQLKRFRTLASLAAYHDPNRIGDEGVALARIAKAPIGDVNVFGAADVLTVRVDPATAATVTLRASSTSLIQVATADAGAQTNSATVKVETGTVVGKKITLSDGQRTFIGDNLGSLLTVRYTGQGSACTLTLRQPTCVITYPGVPSDENTVIVNGVVFEFDTGGGVSSPSHVAVQTGASADEAYANLATAITQNVPGVTATQDGANDTVTLSAPEEGLRVSSSYLVAGTQYVMSGAPVSLVTTVTGEVGEDVFLRFVMPRYSTIGAMADAINAFGGGGLYTASVSVYADRFLASGALTAANIVDYPIKAAALTMTGYAAAIAGWINSNTRGLFAATVLNQGTPDNGTTPFSGGDAQPATISDWETALSVVSANVERGAILLFNTADAAVMTLAAEWIGEQRGFGKWFRAFFGGQAGLATQLGADAAAAQYMQVAATIDSTRVRMTCQRLGVFEANNTITYLDPVYYAAALAGGAAGNKPYVHPLTNKRLRFAGIHPDDNWDVTIRERLLEGGVTVAKKDNERLVVSLAVTTSQDPDKRMARIMSEIDTVDMIDADVRLAFLPFRGKWSTLNVEAMAISVLTQVLTRYVREGALSPGQDEFGNAVPAYRIGNPAAIIQAGLMTLEYQVFIGGELDHISLHGTAEYQRLVGTVQGGTVALSTTVPLH